MEEKSHWIALHGAGFPARTARKLLDRFGSAKAVWEASREVLEKSNLLPREVIAKFLKFRETFSPQTVWEAIQKLNLTVLTLPDSGYPEMLKAISDPPSVLFCKGAWQPNREPALAIVGSRMASPYGKLQAEKMAETLARCGFTIVSGLAMGIDSSAHAGALEGKGNTVAVLGSGVDIIYPYQNTNLAKRIEKQGALVSEFLPGTIPHSWNFPRRNRIISGLSLGVIVVEAKEKSGALITAELALEQGREVFAIPGRPGDQYSAGTNGLIQKGAKLVQEISDVLEEFPYLPIPKVREMQESEMEEKILGLLKKERKGKMIGQLAQESRSTVGNVNAALLSLEVKGLICRLPGNRYVVMNERLFPQLAE